MNDVLLKAFPIPRLEYVFLPPGLPLIAKTPDQPATTSILIRGGAGTGKTTLATAVAHAIAREQEGIALYLTTEFVPTELVYKARMLGLPEGSVAGWTTAGPVPKGAVLTEHLVRTAAGKDVTTSADRKRAAINAAWELIEGDKAGRPEGEARRPPVRVVVIDAFGLPEPEAEDRALRGDLLSLVQALETSGISTILIEEVGGGSSPWMPFIADIVIELSLSSDPDTGELIRKLTCPKSRYAPTLPGPHDYGLDTGRPSLWPDVLPALSQSFWPAGIQVRQDGIFFPHDFAEQYIRAIGGIILVSHYDKSSVVLSALRKTPGLTIASVNCGPVTRVAIPQQKTPLVPDIEGPFSLGWTLLRLLTTGGVKAFLFQNIDFFFGRRRLREGIFHVLETLRAAGAVICVHGRSDQLTPITPIADYVPETKTSGFIVKRTRRRQHRSSVVGSWLALHRFLDRPGAPDAALDPASRQSADLVQQAVATIVRGELTNATMALARAAADPYWVGQLPNELRVAVIVALLQLGAAEQAAEFAMGVLDSASPTARSWIQILIEADLEAAETILSVDNHSLEQPLLQRWQGLCAIYAYNDVALAELQKSVKATPDHEAIGLLLRALAIRGRLADADGVAVDFGERNALPPWFVERLQADLRLESEDRAALQEARVHLERLAAQENLPSIHKAEIVHNLGVACELLGARAQAISCYEHAFAINPHLEAARSRLTELTTTP